jgi:hypothetical protein
LQALKALKAEVAVAHDPRFLQTDIEMTRSASDIVCISALIAIAAKLSYYYYCYH